MTQVFPGRRHGVIVGTSLDLQQDLDTERKANLSARESQSTAARCIDCCPSREHRYIPWRFLIFSPGWPWGIPPSRVALLPPCEDCGGFIFTCTCCSYTSSSLLPRASVVAPPVAGTSWPFPASGRPLQGSERDSPILSPAREPACALSTLSAFPTTIFHPSLPLVS